MKLTHVARAALAGALAAHSLAAGQSQIFALPGSTAGDAYGAWIAPVADVDGDGFVDLLVASGNGATSPGYVRLVSGLKGTTLVSASGSAVGEWFGHAAAIVGDENGDGTSDLAIGAPLADGGGGTASGVVRILSGRDGSPIRSIGGDAIGAHFGWSIAALGDLDGDGVRDLAIGAVDSSQTQVSAGSVYFISGKTGATLKRVDGTAASQLFGYSLAEIGDVDHDGLRDLAVGAPGIPAAQLAGSVRILSAKTGATLATISGGHALDAFGTAVADVGDLDGDQVDDLIVGAPQTNSQLRGYIQVWTQAGTNLAWDIAGDHNGDQFGASVGTAGDLDQNGVADLLIGAPGDDTQALDAGSVRALSGSSGQPFFKLYGSAPNAHLGASVRGGFDANADGWIDVALAATGDAQAGTNAGAVRVLSTHALALTASSHLASLGAGDVQALSLDADPTLAGKPYVVLGSMTGTKPGVVFGALVLPLAADRYFEYTRAPTSHGPMHSSRGTLDASGHAVANFDTKVLPLSVSFIGQTFYHAYVVTDSSGHPLFASNAVPLTILP